MGRGGHVLDKSEGLQRHAVFHGHSHATERHRLDQRQAFTALRSQGTEDRFQFIVQAVSGGGAQGQSPFNGLGPGDPLSRCEQFHRPLQAHAAG